MGAGRVIGLGVAVCRGTSPGEGNCPGFARVGGNGSTPFAPRLPCPHSALRLWARFRGSGLGPSCTRSGGAHPAAIASRSRVRRFGRHEGTISIAGRPAGYPAPSFPRLRSGYAGSLCPQAGHSASRGCFEPRFDHSPESSPPPIDSGLDGPPQPRPAPCLGPHCRHRCTRGRLPQRAGATLAGFHPSRYLGIPSRRAAASHPANGAPRTRTQCRV